MFITSLLLLGPNTYELPSLEYDILKANNIATPPTVASGFIDEKREESHQNYFVYYYLLLGQGYKIHY